MGAQSEAIRPDREQDRVDQVETSWAGLHGGYSFRDASVTEQRVALFSVPPHIGERTSDKWLSLMQTRNPLLNDFADLMTDAFGAAQAVGEEAQAVFRAQADRLVADMDLAGCDLEQIEAATLAAD